MMKFPAVKSEKMNKYQQYFTYQFKIEVLYIYIIKCAYEKFLAWLSEENMMPHDVRDDILLVNISNYFL